MGDGRFAPHDQISREQLAAMMHRDIQNRNIDFSVPSNVTVPEASDWAQEYVRWAVYNGFICAKNPQDDASRAETAVFIVRRVEHYWDG